MSTNRLGRRGRAVHEAILAAAIDELSEHGMSSSVAGVAERAGVHETSAYRRFKTRENLFVQALLGRSGERVAVPDTGSLRGDLLASLQQIVSTLDDPLGVAFLRTRALLDDPAYDDARRSYFEARMEAFLPMLERAVERGELSADVDQLLLLEVLVAPVHTRLLVSSMPIDAELAVRIVDLVLAGVPGART
ncbi:hypothetical protein ASG90_01315 [Nocardioides sp. Soil797]|nr:hypothetical protein ASG90_01315 [Nocardioides sp. Soil797]